MRKLFWCCLVAGAAVCCALGTAVYVSQNPDSALGRFAQAVTHNDGAVPGHPGTTDAAELIPPDPVPVEDSSDAPAVPALPSTTAPLPPAVAALIPPIIIHDEEDLNGPSSPAAKTEPPAAVHADSQASRPPIYDVEEIGRRLVGEWTINDDVAVEPTVAPARMPYCTDDASALPTMPGCIDDGTAPTMPPPGDDGTLNRATPRREAFAWWLGFFSGPSQLMMDPSVGRCEEDPHYGEQYPGAPYTVRQGSTDQPARSDGKAPPAFPGADENSEPPAKTVSHLDPRELFNHSHHPQTPRLAEPQSDTMEMRPSDWKPYSLDPGPF